MKKISTSLENATTVLNSALQVLQAGKKGYKAEVTASIQNALEMIEAAKKEMEPKTDPKKEERERLQELCKKLREWADNGGVKLSTNQLLNGYYYDHGANRLATQDSWEAKGAKVNDDAKPYLFWGSKETRFTRDGRKYDYYNVEYRYDVKEVTFLDDDIAPNEADGMVQ